MIPGLPLAFANPWLLTALIALPALWLLLRLVPPRPRRIAFPPTGMLFDIAPKEETPARTPWWLLLLRLLLAALVILAMAGPNWNPPAVSSPSRQTVLLIDDGWPAAASWTARMANGEDIVRSVEAAGGALAVVPLSQPVRDVPFLPPAEARQRLRALTPVPHGTLRLDMLAGLEKLLQAAPAADVIWLADGVDLGGDAAFVEALARLSAGRRLIVLADGLPAPMMIGAAQNATAALTVTLRRPRDDGRSEVRLRALDMRGLSLADVPARFAAGALEAEAHLALPVELRNEAARLEITGEASSGAVHLLDRRNHRRRVGIISGTGSDAAQRLLAPTHYLVNALSPFADVSVAEGSTAEAVETLVDRRMPVIALADVGTLPAPSRERLSGWIEAGGLLIRFAGPRMAGGADDLVPVRLRRGGRTLVGALSWDKPQSLALFPKEGAFADLLPPADVTVNRQVLAEPDARLAERSWAVLADGTPLVTAEKRGKGLMVLFHVTADTRWSNLPLSGVFVEMLSRLVQLAGTTLSEGGEATAQPLPPLRVLDGFGAFTAPQGAKPIAAGFAGRASLDHPPGFYGPADSPFAVNALSPKDRPAMLDLAPLGGAVTGYRLSAPLDLRTPLLTLASLLLIVDAALMLWLSGGWRQLRPRHGAGAALLLLALLAPPMARAETPADFAIKAAHETRLAYVVTGDGEIDAISRAGLEGLSLFLSQRTALEPGEPVGIDVARDELAFFPLLYWPVNPAMPRPDAAALARIDAYMKQGGTILFDTRDALLGTAGDGPGMAALRDMLAGLDIPALEPVSKDHVLTKTFFLLKEFPGRAAYGSLWVEALAPPGEDGTERPARGGDGVSPILITGNDLAGAWAIDQQGRPMLPLIPDDPRQRELAFRVGVNVVMYVLTGNYKADQVHVPALLERLGQ